MTTILQFKRLASLWLPPLAWMVLIFYLSSRPGLAIGEGAVDFWTRKPAHIGEYAILFFLLHRALGGSFGWARRKLYWVVGSLTFLYAVLDEIHQAFVPLREGKIEDLGFDLLGILVAVIFLLYSRKYMPDST